MVGVDRFTKMVLFFPYSTYFSAKDNAEIFIWEIFSRHRLPDKIISDRGHQFVSKLWTQFLKCLYINPYLSLGYHLQSDGQTKRLNLILEQYLRCSVPAEYNDWFPCRQVAQFA